MLTQCLHSAYTVLTQCLQCECEAVSGPLLRSYTVLTQCFHSGCGSRVLTHWLRFYLNVLPTSLHSLHLVRPNITAPPYCTSTQHHCIPIPSAQQGSPPPELRSPRSKLFFGGNFQALGDSMICSASPASTACVYRLFCLCVAYVLPMFCVCFAYI